jgi:MFS family permease
MRRLTMMGIWTALVLLIVGALIWLANMGILNWNWGRDWPWILIVLGILGIAGAIWRKVRNAIRRRPTVRRVIRVNRAEILKDLEEGKITSEEAERRLRGD